MGNRPVDSATRRAPALWDIAEAFGRRATVVNWWTAWPAPREGAVVFDTPVVQQASAIHPQQFSSQVARLGVPVNTVQYPQARRFLNITEREWDNAIANGGPNDPIKVFREVLAKTWTDHRVGIGLYQRQEPLVMMMSYEGTDAVNHLFAPYHPPYREGVSQGNFRKYWPTVANYYSEIDRLIGEWMKVLTDDTTLILVSAHGFRWDDRRPRVQPAGRSALSDHRNPGIFIAYGNHVPPDRGGHVISIYDVVPTVLSLLGLPKSSEMPGEHAGWVFRDVAPVTSVRVISYDEFFPGSGIIRGASIDADRYAKHLQAIGHLTDPSRTAVFEDGDMPVPAASRKPIPPEKWGAYAYQNNLGIELRRQGKHREAIEAFQRAINLNPTRPTPYLNMAMTLFEQQQYTAADDVFIMAVTRGLPNGDQWFADFAALYRSQDMATRAINLLYKGKQLFPQSYIIAANLGGALAQANRYAEGIPELERALGLQPSSTSVLNNLGIYYARRREYARALDFWNRSLSLDPQQPAIREAADAARTRL
jgi:Tfp pilus assembly protein PilF